MHSEKTGNFFFSDVSDFKVMKPKAYTVLGE